MAESEDKTIKNVLNEIKSEILKRKQLRAQNQTNKELEKLSSKLDMQRGGNESVHIPTVQEIVKSLSHISPIFTRDFSAWMKNTLSIAESSNNELTALNNNMLKPMDSNQDSTSEEYLDLITDHLKIIGNETHDGFGAVENKLELIRIGLGDVSGVIEDSQKSGQVTANRDSRQQTLLLLGIDKKIGSSVGQVVNQLIRIRDDNAKWNEKQYLATQEALKDAGSPHPQAGSRTPTSPDDQNGDGLPDVGGAGGLLAGAGALVALGLFKKVLGAPLALIRGLTGVFTGFGGITKLLKPLTKLFRAGPLALLSAAWDFGKGFINAGEILGKDKVTVVDRIRAGSSELLGGFGDLLDWVTKIFGFDTDFGKVIRENFLSLSKKPAEWAQAVVDWFKNDLFSGISWDTSLTDIPGILADNLQNELIKLVLWVTKGISELIDNIKEGGKNIFISMQDAVLGVIDKSIEGMKSFGNDLKSGFDEKIKKPFYAMINGILNTVFDVVDSFVKIIPDSLGGETARQKLEEARKSMLLGGDSNTPQSSPTMAAVGANLPTQAATVSTDPALGGTPPTPLSVAIPNQGRAVTNAQQIRDNEKATLSQTTIQQNNNNAKSITTNNVYNSQTLEPRNKSDMSNVLWGWE